MHAIRLVMTQPMKMPFAIALSAAVHIAAGAYIQHTMIKPNSVKQAQTTLMVSLKESLTANLSNNPSLKSRPNAASDRNNELASYLNEHDVESKALPRSNIDDEKLGDLFISGLAIKMRLYIDREGHVVKVEALDALTQDHRLQMSLKKILLEITFIPAQKHGVAVNTYQEIALSFDN